MGLRWSILWFSSRERNAYPGCKRQRGEILDGWEVVVVVVVMEQRTWEWVWVMVDSQ